MNQRFGPNRVLRTRSVDYLGGCPWMDAFCRSLRSQIVTQAKSAVLQRNPQAIRELFKNDHDAAVYIVARPDVQKVLSELRKVDQAKQLMASSGDSAEKKRSCNRAARHLSPTAGREPPRWMMQLKPCSGASDSLRAFQ